MSIAAGVAIAKTAVDVATALTIITTLAIKVKAAHDAGESTVTVEDEIAMLEKARLATSAQIISEADKAMGKG